MESHTHTPELERSCVHVQVYGYGVQNSDKHRKKLLFTPTNCAGGIILSARSRGAKRMALDFPGPLPETDSPKRPSQSWARCVAKTFEIDPLTCPKCGASMQIKAFIHSSTEINRIADNLGIVIRLR